MPQKNTEQYKQLRKILTQMFQLDQAELDFGIYRIMNQKREEINAFMENALPTQIKEILQESGSSDLKELKAELQKLESTLRSAGVDPDENSKVQEMREEYAKGGSVETMELEVYSRLTQFFKRYYKEGDFISQRRYKDGVYAIPYEGEEVKLHWANHDQYYIKTGEYFKNYSFKADGENIHFVLKEADTERDNNKAQAGKERRFKLFKSEDHPSFEETENGELNIYFTYEPAEKKEKQDKLNEKTVKWLAENLPGKWTQVLLQKKPTEKNKNRTLLEYRLTDYTAKNSFDYFIHKDLGKFLRQELDFYIKNEILHLDDIDLNGEQSFQKQLTLIKALKKVALKIIAFLAQLEDFQKKLFLKKKMVLQSDYCITLDRIDEDFYEDIANNKAQLKEWEELFDFSIEEALKGTYTDKKEGELNLSGATVPNSKIEVLKFNPYLLVDTKFFSTEWKYKLLSTIDNIDKQNDGLLINSENFQALNLLQERYREQVKTVYIDPPYNTDSSEIIYKNSYKNSSWLSLMSDRIERAKALQVDGGFLFVAIDDLELFKLNELIEALYTRDNFIANISVIHKPEGRNQEKFFGTSNEYMLVYANNKENADFYKVIIDAQLKKKFNFSDSYGLYKRKNFIRLTDGKYALRVAKPDFFYPIYYNDDFSKVSIDEFEGANSVFPITESGVERTWKTKPETFYEYYKKGNIEFIRENNTVVVYEKLREDQVIKTHWNKKEYHSYHYGTKPLEDILGEKLFDFPKSVITVLDTLKITTKFNEIVLDYFAGSGTTAHAVINLNREDEGNRKYILVEMGEYFNTVTKPRIQKVIYSEEWKNGKPVNRKGSSHCFKYMRLESYEDTLNNLYLTKGDIDQAMQEEYLLHYSLDVESRDSLLMLDAFKKPFGYKIKSTENNELIETEVDLVETFNYLIGLQVKSMEIIRGYVVVTGETLDEKKVLVIWRDMDKHSNADLNEFFSKMKFNPLDGEFDQIYVNGDNNIENLRTGEQRWKVKLIEFEFHKRMWENNA